MSAPKLPECPENAPHTHGQCRDCGNIDCPKVCESALFRQCPATREISEVERGRARGPVRP